MSKQRERERVRVSRECNEKFIVLWFVVNFLCVSVRLFVVEPQYNACCYFCIFFVVVIRMYEYSGLHVPSESGWFFVCW